MGEIAIPPPPLPPIPINVWEGGIECPVCGEKYNVKPGLNTCPKCGFQVFALDWDWQSFLIGLALGLVLGLVLSIAAYYLILKPYSPLAEFLMTLAPKEVKKVE